MEPVRTLARTDIDVAGVLGGAFSPWTSIAERVEKVYDRTLFGGATLQDLPDEPRFVFNATNLESGVLMRFGKAYLADYRVGRVDQPTSRWRSRSPPPRPSRRSCPPARSTSAGQTGSPRTATTWRTSTGFRDEISLSDGGVYDNLGIESAWKRYRTLLVSDAGGPMGADPTCPSDWGRGLLRVLMVIDNQVRSLRKQQVVGAFRAGARDGMYVGIRSDLERYPVTDPLPADPRGNPALAPSRPGWTPCPRSCRSSSSTGATSSPTPGCAPTSTPRRGRRRAALPRPTRSPTASDGHAGRQASTRQPHGAAVVAAQPARRGEERGGAAHGAGSTSSSRRSSAPPSSCCAGRGPYADRLGRLFWDDDADDRVMSAAVPQRLVRLQLYRPNDLQRRPRAGDTFAAKITRAAAGWDSTPRGRRPRRHLPRRGLRRFRRRPGGGEARLPGRHRRGVRRQPEPWTCSRMPTEAGRSGPAPSASRSSRSTRSSTTRRTCRERRAPTSRARHPGPRRRRRGIAGRGHPRGPATRWSTSCSTSVTATPSCCCCRRTATTEYAGW